jgi:hypothetical protein
MQFSRALSGESHFDNQLSFLVISERILQPVCQMRKISETQVQNLLLELKSKNKARVEGKTSASIWFPG